MKLCIVGPVDRKETDLRLLETAKKNFDSVLYVPFPNISLSINDITRVSYKSVDLSRFDAVLPRIPKERNLFGYLLFTTLNLYTPVSARAFLVTSDRFLMLDILKKDNFPVPPIYFTDSIVTAKNLTEKIKFPAVLRIPGTEKGVAFANTAKEAKTILDTLGTFRKPIYLEEFFESSYIQAYVVAGHVIAAVKRRPEGNDIYFGKGTPKKVHLSTGMKNLAIGAAGTVRADFAMVEMIKEPRCVFNVNICPPIMEAIKTTGIDIDQYLMEAINSMGRLEKKPELSLLTKILRSTGSRVKDLLEK